MSVRRRLGRALALGRLPRRGSAIYRALVAWYPHYGAVDLALLRMRFGERLLVIEGGRARPPAARTAVTPGPFGPRRGGPGAAA